MNQKELVQELRRRMEKLRRDYGGKAFLTSEELWLEALLARIEAEEVLCDPCPVCAFHRGYKVTHVPGQEVAR